MQTASTTLLRTKLPSQDSFLFFFFWFRFEVVTTLTFMTWYAVVGMLHQLRGANSYRLLHSATIECLFLKLCCCCTTRFWVSKIVNGYNNRVLTQCHRHQGRIDHQGDSRQNPILSCLCPTIVPVRSPTFSIFGFCLSLFSTISVSSRCCLNGTAQ